MNTCIGFNCNLEKCKFNIKNGSKTCKFHTYMEDYTEEMINNIKFCKTCRKVKYIELEYQICLTCRDRGKNNRKNRRKILENNKDNMCLYVNCKFKRCTLNEYCGKHQLQLFVKETQEKNKKTCCNYIRGCRTQLDLSYNFSKCIQCLSNDRLKDNTNRKNALIIRKNENDSNSEVRTCTICTNEFPIEYYFGNKEISEELTLTCRNCREQNNKQNIKRDKQHRRDATRKSINVQYTEYKKNAKNRSIDFYITKDQYKEIIKKECNYCGTIDIDKGFNGLDRLNSRLSYDIDNVVSCCIMCNYMKRTDLPNIFITKVKNIIDYYKFNKSINTISNSYSSNISINTHYNNYKTRTKVSNIVFNLNLQEFENICLESCYLCGKKTEKNIHLNGIDRVNNNEGYILDNCKCCCRDCNFMKNDTPLLIFINKLETIYKYNMEI
jgi:hypothetical protein